VAPFEGRLGKRSQYPGEPVPSICDPGVLIYEPLNCGRQNGRMKIALAAAAGWIAFYVADMALFGGYYAQGLGRLVTALSQSLGLYF
jgi:hypothetical protein